MTSFTRTLQAFTSQVDCSATLELLMVTYDNPSGRAADGKQCDVGFLSDRPDCDHIFRFALDLGNRYEPTSNQHV